MDPPLRLGVELNSLARSPAACRLRSVPNARDKPLIPTVQTERLTLRPIVDSDAKAMEGFFADESSKFYGGPCDAAMTWRRMATYAGSWVLRGYGPFAIERRGDGAFVGVCGPWYPEGWAEPEITWALTPEARGYGYASEAAEAALRFAYNDLGWETAVSVVAVENAASSAVAERIGACYESDLDYVYGPARLYRHLLPGELK